MTQVKVWEEDIVVWKERECVGIWVWVFRCGVCVCVIVVSEYDAMATKQQWFFFF